MNSKTADPHEKNSDVESNPSNFDQVHASNFITQLVSEVKFISEMISDSTTRESALEDLNDLANLKTRYENFILCGKQGAATTYQEKKLFVTAYRDTREKLLSITNAVSCVSHSSKLFSSRNGHFEATTHRQQVLKVPTFSGVDKEWTTFRENFLQLIGDDHRADKLRYLKMALKGDAAMVIEKMKGANFNECWKALCQIYDHPFLKMRTHLEALFKNETNELSVRSLSDVYSEHAIKLRSASNEINVDAYEMIVITLFLNKVPPCIGKSWETEISKMGTSHCTMKNFFNFIERECKALDRRMIDSRSLLPVKYLNPPLLKKCVSNKDANCPQCGGQHYLNKCPTFIGMSKRERIEYVVQHGICRICLNGGCRGREDPRNCSAKFLKCKCNGLHNGLLHLFRPVNTESTSL